MGDFVDGVTSNNPGQSNNTSSANNSDTYQSTNPFATKSELDYLKSIDATLKNLLKNSQSTSQANAKYSMPRRGDFRYSDQPLSGKWAPTSSRYSRGSRGRSSRTTEGFIDGFQSAMLESFLGSDFKDKIRASLDDFADIVGADLKDVPNALGKELGRQLLGRFKNTKMGQQVTDSINNMQHEAASWIDDLFNRYRKNSKAQPTSSTSSGQSDTAESVRSVNSAQVNIDRDTERSQNLTRSVSDMTVQSVNIVAESVIISKKGNSGYPEDSSDSISYPESSDRASDLRDEGLSERIDRNNSIQQYQPTEYSNQSDIPGPESTNRAEESIHNLGDMIGDDLLGDQSKRLKDIAFNSIDRTFRSVFGDNIVDTAKSALGNVTGFFKDKLGSLFGNSASVGAQVATQAGAGAVESTALSTLGSTTSAGTALAEGSGAAAGAASLTAGAEGAAAGLSMVAEAAVAFVGPLLLLVAATMVVTAVMEALGPAIEGAQKVFEKMGEAANRYSSTRKKKMEESQKRFEADIRSMTEAPFKILEDAAQNVYDAWDKNVRLINATQGYTKAELQDLMSAYSQRLRQEGLTEVISASDITDNLANVLNSGLSGQAAVEFAYLATKLEAAIPSQNFFDYADTYASIASNAIKAGASQSEAISYANSQLEEFASNVLYANRELSGGFTTGLKDVGSLFDQAVQISQAAKTNNATEISGVLTSVAATVGSIAPDIANSITDVVYKAATGGNSSELVALRSLAGTGASNSDFLRAFATDPQSVMSTLFYNLSSLQNMSDNNSMEVAEALSSVFGISMDAFSRVDFNYLAQAISEMNTNNNALKQNMLLLKSGETTTTTEQLKIQQINKYMLEEGLAYVLDNEVTRSIQEHMWEEQLALEMQEATYGVELQGAALEFLEGIRETVDNIVNLLNPFAWASKIANLIGTTMEVYGQEGDIRRLLELSKVGNGNLTSLYQLTTRGTDLNLTPNIITLMGGQSMYESISTGRKIVTGLLNTYNTVLDGMGNLVNGAAATVQYGLDHSGNQIGNIDSLYNWGMVGKSTARLLLGDGIASGSLISSSYDRVESRITNAAQSAVTASIEKMLSKEYLEDKYVKEGKTYEDWAASAQNFDIQDLGKALEDAGYSETQVQSYFQQKQVEEGNSMQQERYNNEEDFWDKGRQFWIDEANYTVQLIELVTTTNARLDTIIEQFTDFHGKWDTFRKDFTWKQFYSDWVDYFINHTVYNDSYDYTSVDRIFRDEKKSSEDAIAGLVEAFRNTTSDLKDPTIQTNVLLAEILAIVNAIMQQNNKPESSSSGFSLVDTFAALSTGLIKQV